MSEPETRHLPEPDPDTEPFWTAAQRGRLQLQRCRSCRRSYHYPRARCPGCWSADTEWVVAAGTGTIWTYTVVRQNLARPFRDRVPYVLAVIELDEGPRMLATVHAEPGDVSVGQTVSVDYLTEADGTAVPVFRLTS